MSSRVEQKKPISPKQLFQRLISGNYKQIECIDEASHMRQQKQILVSLINQYRLQIGNRMQQFDKLQQLVKIRNSLRVSLQRLRSQRISIDQDIEFQIERHRAKPAQIQDQAQRRVQLDQLKFKNAGLEGRLNELNQYIHKIQRHNALLQKQNIIVQQSQSRGRSVSDVCYGGCPDDRCGVLRQRIKAMKLQQNIQQRNIIEKAKIKQEESLMKARLQEQEIAERNRRRMLSFQERFRYN